MCVIATFQTFAVTRLEQNTNVKICRLRRYETGCEKAFGNFARTVASGKHIDSKEKRSVSDCLPFDDQRKHSIFVKPDKGCFFFFKKSDEVSSFNLGTCYLCPEFRRAET